MFNFLLKIRSQSESKKKKLLVIFTIIIMLMISGVWYFLSGINVGGSIKYDKKETSETSDVGFLIGVFEDFFGSVSDNLIQIKEDF